MRARWSRLQSTLDLDVIDQPVMIDHPSEPTVSASWKTEASSACAFLETNKQVLAKNRKRLVETRERETETLIKTKTITYTHCTQYFATSAIINLS